MMRATVNPDGTVTLHGLSTEDAKLLGRMSPEDLDKLVRRALKPKTGSRKTRRVDPNQS